MSFDVEVDEIAPTSTTTRAAGSGSVRVMRVGTRSVVTHAFASSPLRLLTPRNHGNGAWIYTSTYGGGLVDCDALDVDLEVGEGATVLLATQAATKVYRSPHGTSAQLNVTVRNGGLLILAPDPVVCFEGSSYCQVQRFDLEDSAGLVYLDWFSSGRHAAGERWQFDCYQSRVFVRHNGRLVMLDAITLDRREDDLGKRMGRFDAVLVAAILGPSLEPHAAGIVSRVERLSVTKGANLLVGASAIAGGGCVLRIAGTSAEEVGREARGYLAFVRTLLGDDPWARKW
jgi:urease accessory protein